MNEEDYVSLETAKLLKNKGFNVPCLYQYTDKGTVWRCFDPENFNAYETCCSCPTLYEAQKWLRRKHNIHIKIDNSACGYEWFLYKANNGTYISDSAWTGPNSGGCWDTYEESLNAGILEALELITKLT